MIYAAATAGSLALWSGLVATAVTLALTLDTDRFNVWEDE